MNASELHRNIKEQPFKSLNELVYEYLFEKIINMTILPETKINETKLAKELEISRSPIRFAIDRLYDEQFITKIGNKKIVTSITPDDFLQLTQARVFIEGTASGLAAKVIKEEELKKLKVLATKFEETIESIELENFETYDHEFHSCIVNACENPYIIDMYNCIKHQVLRYRYSLRYKVERKTLQRLLKSTVKSHWTLCNSLEMGYSAMAKDESAYHSDAMRDAFVNWR